MLCFDCRLKMSQTLVCQYKMSCHLLHLVTKSVSVIAGILCDIVL